MIYIGFSTQTNKLTARVLCKKYKHCAPVFISGKNYYLYQFTNMKKINVIPLKKRDISILQKHSWIFIKYHGKTNLKKSLKNKSLTCVQFTKRACKIKNNKIITPYDLFKYLTQK